MEYYLATKNGWTTDTCNDVDESQKYYSAWKKPEPKEYTQYHSIYITF